jgi:hypothetical protein
MPGQRTASEFLRAGRYGVLATQSRSLPGYPFGSITPYVLSAAGEPIIYISTLAEHTKNIGADPRVSLTVFDPADAADPQAGARLTWLADACALTPGAAQAIAARYYRFFPAAAAYAGTHDFSFYALRPVRLRYIGGFGKIGWIEPQQIDLTNPLADAEAGIVEHMNNDHTDALRTYCRHFFGRDAQQAVLVGADADGVDLLADGTALRLPFAARASDSDALRQRLIELLRVAREASARA